METKSFLRLLFLLFSALLLLIFTSFYLHLPYDPPETAQVLQCSSFPSWCTSKNRIGNSTTKLLPEKPKQPISVNRENNLPHHPLDPLTADEISRTRSILLSTPPFSSSPFTIHSLVLSEPDKSVVVQWKRGDRLPPRRASVIALLGSDAHVATVDLAGGRVVDRVVSTASGYPTLSIEDMNAATAAPLTDSEFNRTVRRRGVDLTDVACLPISAGWFGKKEEGRRVMKVQCYSLKDTANFYMRPIEGVTVLVDLDSKQVVRISDKGKGIPIPKADNTEYRQSENGNDHATVRLNPISIEQPKGPSFTIEDGHTVRWANWEFHLKADPRSGSMISQVSPNLLVVLCTYCLTLPNMSHACSKVLPINKMHD